MTDDPIGDAVRADAEAARAEVRAEGIVCPSCGVNMTDLPDGHALAITGVPGGPFAAECAAGTPVRLDGVSPVDAAGFALWQAAANVQVWDEMSRRWDDYARKNIIGERPADAPPHEFTGLLDALGG